MKLFRTSAPHITESISEDMPALASIHARCFDYAWSDDDIATTVDVKGTRCIVAKQSGNIAKNVRGFLIYRSIGDQAEILTIAVDPKYRKRGIAKSLLEFAVRKLQNDRVEQFFLEVSEKNRAAIELYKSLAFKQVAVRKGYYASNNTKSGSQISNALVMKLELR